MGLDSKKEIMTQQISHRQGWQFEGNIHAKTHGHIKNDYAKTHDLAIVNPLQFQKRDKV